MRGVMLNLRSIWREADVVQGQQLDSTRKILHGLKATQDDAVGGRLELCHPESQGLKSEVRSLRSEVQRPTYLLNLCSFRGSPYMW
jgi:hypothetical protein